MIAMMIVFVGVASISLSLSAKVDKFNAGLMDLANRERCDYRELLLICGIGGLALIERGDVSVWDFKRADWRLMRPIRDPDVALAKMLELGVSSDAAASLLEEQKRLACEYSTEFKRWCIPGAAFILIAFAADALLA